MAAGGQDGAVFYIAWQIDFYCHNTMHTCAKGDVCSIWSFVKMHFVTSIQTMSRYPSIALCRFIRNESAQKAWLNHVDHQQLEEITVGQHVAYRIHIGLVGIQSTQLTALSTSTEKAKGIWLCADHFSAQYQTKPLDPTTHSAANA
jgi:hypothetical protein